VLDAPRRLDQRPDTALPVIGVDDLRNDLHVTRGLDLGDEQHGGPQTGLGHGQQVLQAVHRARRVQPQTPRRGVAAGSSAGPGEPADHGIARGVLAIEGDGILQIQQSDVGARTPGRFEPAGGGGRGDQPGAAAQGARTVTGAGVAPGALCR
jgi:hypothetical protein